MKNISKEIEKICKEYDTEFDPTLSKDFIREFKDKVDWYYISRHQKLSEDFIREFKDKIDWENISEYQKLSEGFIREFKDQVNWNQISAYQKLSEGFRKEFNIEVRDNCKLSQVLKSTPIELTNKDYPHICPKCKGPAYIGMNNIDCPTCNKL
jgi:hypothetical protein